MDTPFTIRASFRLCVLALGFSLGGSLGCGGPSRGTAPPGSSHAQTSFDAKAIAAGLNALTSEMADAATAPDLECSALVTRIGEIEERGRPLVERAREAELDPEHAKQLTRELHVYDNLATGRSDAIARRLKICFSEHSELKQQIEQVVDALPTL